jgi:hypothetical protein
MKDEWMVNWWFMINGWMDEWISVALMNDEWLLDYRWMVNNEWWMDIGSMVDEWW